MPNYRRARVPGATYFFTVVTAGRRPLLNSADAIRILRQSVENVREILPFTVNAWVVIPDHIHAIWTLPDSDADFLRRWGCIKAGFTQHCGLSHRAMSRRDAGIWQPRFWEHLIRDTRDFDSHMDYLHYNPVKHGHVQRGVDWPYSSFHRCVRQGIYAADWGGCEPAPPATRVGE